MIHHWYHSHNSQRRSAKSKEFSQFWPSSQNWKWVTPGLPTNCFSWCAWMSVCSKLLWMVLESWNVSSWSVEVVLLNNMPLGAQHRVSRSSGMQGVRQSVVSHIVPFRWEEKLLWGCWTGCRQLWRPDCCLCYSGSESPSFQRAGAAAVLQEQHLCGCMCTDEILHLL